MTVVTRKIKDLSLLGTLQAGDVIVGERTTGTSVRLTVPSLAGVEDGDKGDITVASSGTVWTIDTPSAATVATDDKILIKDTSALNVMKYVTAQSIADLAPAGYTDEQAQDAVGAMVDTSLTYVDSTPLLQRAALTGDITASAGSNITAIANDAVTYAKMQNVSATDKLLGRSSSGAGDVEEIALTSAGRALIDDADASAQRTTLGLGTLATQSGTFSGTSSGTNTGDQTSIVGITGTKAQFNTAVTDGDIVYTDSLGTNVATFLATPSSANLAAALTDETGSGAVVFSNAPTMTGALNMGSHLINAVTDPSNAQDAATKNYVDSVVAGLNPKEAANYASTVSLTVTYSNGVAGVGATLTNAGTQVAFALDGGSPSAGQRILIKNQSSGIQNGVYDVTSVGSASTNWVLTRSSDYNTVTAINNSGIIPVISGTAGAGTMWLETSSVSVIGTDALVFTQFGQLAGTVAVGSGGTGRASATAYAPIVGGTTSTGAFQSTASGSTGQMLQSAGNAAVPTWSTPTYPSASGTSGKFLISDGTNNVYTTSTIPTSAGATSLKHLRSDGTNYVLTTATISDSPGTAGKMLVSDGTNWITSTPTFPNASATSRKITVSDGTNWVASTETYAVPGSAGNLLRSDGTNWTAAKATLTTDVTGILPIANGGSGASSTKPVIQRVYTETGALATGTTQIPGDNTIPQNTEGDQYMSLAITPSNTSNILEIKVTAANSSSAIASVGVALFQDTTANALAAAYNIAAVANAPLITTFTHTMVAGTTSATTFKVRIGANTASTISFNGQVSAGIYGGVMASSIIITEYTV